MKSNQYGGDSPRVGTFQRISSRKDSQFHTGPQEYTQSKHRITESDPRIIITPVNEEHDQLNSSVYTPRLSAYRSSPYSPKKVGLKRHVSVLLGPAVNKDDPLGALASSNKVEDPLKRKTVFSSRVRASRSGQGRLLSILAGQAVIGKHHDITKIFVAALVFI